MAQESFRLSLTKAIAIGLSLWLLSLMPQHGEAQRLLGDYSSLEIEVHELPDLIVFEFFRLQKVAESIQRVPALVDYVTIDTGWEPTQRLWSVFTRDHQSCVSKIAYGVVPSGFIQLAPQSGSPAPLEARKLYYVSARGDGMGTIAFSLHGK